MAIDPGDIDGAGDEVARHMAAVELVVLAGLAKALRDGVPSHAVRAQLIKKMLSEQKVTAALAIEAVDVGRKRGEDAAMKEIGRISAKAEVPRVRQATSPGPYLVEATPTAMVRHGSPNRRHSDVSRAKVELVNETVRAGLHDAALNTARRTAGMYEAVVREVGVAMLEGEIAGRQVQQRALDEWARRGLPAFTDKAGRTWSNQAYSEMLTRTAVHRAYQDAADSTLQAEGYDLVIVSSHRNPAPVCQPYELKVLSLSGANRGTVHVPSAVDGRPLAQHVYASMAEAEAAGFRHPNCRHGWELWVPGMTVAGDTEPNPEGYEATQQQRAMERKVREWKRRKAVAGSEDEVKAANVKIREWQGKIREHIDEHGLSRQYHREQPRSGKPAA